MSCCPRKVTLHRVTLDVETAGDFSVGLLKMPYGYRIFGPAAWTFAPSGSPATINLVTNTPKGTAIDQPKTTLDTLLFAGTTDEPGAFTIMVPLVPFEDIEYTFVP